MMKHASREREMMTNTSRERGDDEYSVWMISEQEAFISISLLLTHSLSFGSIPRLRAANSEAEAGPLIRAGG
jgi:hypothetical protein